MIVNNGEIIANNLESEAYPIGTQLDYSDMTINSGATEVRTMRPGTLVGYDEIGGRNYVLVQPNDESGIPFGQPKVICTKGLSRFVEILEIDPDAELI
jgi:hypothetical protein